MKRLIIIALVSLIFICISDSHAFNPATEGKEDRFIGLGYSRVDLQKPDQ